MLLGVFLSFVLGLVIASYLNVLVLRYETHEKTSTGRSQCTSCKKEIAWYDNIPLLSFLILRARCRHCREAISWQYPLVELAGGILFALSFLHVDHLVAAPLFSRLAFEWTLWSILLAAVVHDIRAYIIPDRYSFLPVRLLGSRSFCCGHCLAGAQWGLLILSLLWEWGGSWVCGVVSRL